MEPDKLEELYVHAMQADEALSHWMTGDSDEEMAKALMSRLVGFAMAIGKKPTT